MSERGDKDAREKRARAERIGSSAATKELATALWRAESAYDDLKARVLAPIINP